VVANGDIDSPIKIKKVLAITAADAIMISRVAHRRPRLFSEIHHSLSTAKLPQEPTIAEFCNIMLGHLENLYEFYGELKHVNRIEMAAALGRRIVDDYFDTRELVA
jgi:tRNA-dihydrouridine synthase B